MRKRASHRFTKRLEVTFSSGGSKYRGISSDVSASGIFIRTQHGLTPGSVIDIEIYLPEGKIAHVKGVVKRTVKAPLTMVKNGMGVEFTEKDSSFLEFLGNFDLSAGPEAASQSERPAGGRAEEVPQQATERSSAQIPEFAMIACHECGVKNKVPRERLQFSPKCGKCGVLLKTADFI